MTSQTIQRGVAKGPAEDMKEGKALESRVEHQSYRSYRSQDKIAER